jgi:hypothetical protein
MEKSIEVEVAIIVDTVAMPFDSMAKFVWCINQNLFGV